MRNISVACPRRAQTFPGLAGDLVENSRLPASYRGKVCYRQEVESRTGGEGAAQRNQRDVRKEENRRFVRYVIIAFLPIRVCLVNCAPWCFGCTLRER